MKIVITVCALLLSVIATPTHAAGPFDGVYTFNFNGSLVGYTSIHENNGTMIALIIEPSPFDSTWEAISGVRNNNTVRLSSIFGTVSLVIDISFNSDNSTGTATIISCADFDDDPSNDSDNCDFPANTVFNLIKIF